MLQTSNLGVLCADCLWNGLYHQDRRLWVPHPPVKRREQQAVADAARFSLTRCLQTAHCGSLLPNPLECIGILPKHLGRKGVTQPQRPLIGGDCCGVLAIGIGKMPIHLKDGRVLGVSAEQRYNQVSRFMGFTLQ